MRLSPGTTEDAITAIRSRHAGRRNDLRSSNVAMHTLACGLQQMEAVRLVKAAEIFNQRASRGLVAKQYHRERSAAAERLLEGDMNHQREITGLRGRGQRYEAANARNASNKEGISAVIATTGASPLAPSGLLSEIAVGEVSSVGVGTATQVAVKRTTRVATKKMQGLRFCEARGKLTRGSLSEKPRLRRRRQRA